MVAAWMVDGETKSKVLHDRMQPELPVTLKEEKLKQRERGGQKPSKMKARSQSLHEFMNALKPLDDSYIILMIKIAQDVFKSGKAKLDDVLDKV